MKKLLFLLIFFLGISQSFAVQWNGSNNPPSTIVFATTNSTYFTSADWDYSATGSNALGATYQGFTTYTPIGDGKNLVGLLSVSGFRKSEINYYTSTGGNVLVSSLGVVPNATTRVGVNLIVTSTVSPTDYVFYVVGGVNSTNSFAEEVLRIPKTVDCGANGDMCAIAFYPRLLLNGGTAYGAYAQFTDIVFYSSSGSAIFKRVYHDGSVWDGGFWLTQFTIWSLGYDSRFGRLLSTSYYGSDTSSTYIPQTYGYPIVSSYRPTTYFFHPLYSLCSSRFICNNAFDVPVRDWLVGNTGSNLVYTAKQYFNFTSVTALSSSGSTGTNTSTGSTSCGFTDLSCNISSLTTSITSSIGGIITSLTSSISSSISSLFSNLFPTISFSGTSDTCANSGTTNTGTTSTGASIGFTQKMVNMFVILLPTAPVEGSTVCTLTGPTVIHYSNKGDILDIILVITVFFTAILAHKKPEHV